MAKADIDEINRQVEMNLEIETHHTRAKTNQQANRTKDKDNLAAAGRQAQLHEQILMDSAPRHKEVEITKQPSVTH